MSSTHRLILLIRVFLKVSLQHTLYYEQCGHPQGKPVLFVHGGPGVGIASDDRRFFNPSLYRIILVDQRGCGKSTPHALLAENTTQDLVEDFEKIRQHLGVDQWLLFGGSWGSTLSLAYAQTYAERVSAMVLRGVFLGQRSEVDWLFRGKGANQIFPDFWDEFVADFSLEEQRDMVASYYVRLTSDQTPVVQRAAAQWSRWESSIAQLVPDQQAIEHFSTTDIGLACARLECHYSQNNFFLHDHQLLNHMEVIKHIPSILVQGRYDIVCSAKNAWDLHQAWPQSELCFIKDAGHRSVEVGITDRLVRATDQLA